MSRFLLFSAPSSALLKLSVSCYTPLPNLTVKLFLLLLFFNLKKINKETIEHYFLKHVYDCLAWINLHLGREINSGLPYDYITLRKDRKFKTIEESEKY